MPGVAFPPVGPVRLRAPPAQGLGSAQTASLALAEHFAWRSRPDTLPVSVRSWGPSRARDLGETPKPPQGLCSPAPPCREWDKETGGSPTFPRYPWAYLPRSEPPGGPAYAPSRPPAGCRPATGNRRRSSLYGLASSPVVHASTLCGARSRGLPPHSLQRRTSIAGGARGWHV
jgi:hypothetical protein